RQREREPHVGDLDMAAQLAPAVFVARPRDRFLVGLPDAEGASQQAREDRIRRLPVVGPAPGRPPFDAGAEASRKFRDQPALADPRFTGNGEGATPAEDSTSQGSSEKRELGAA